MNHRNITFMFSIFYKKSFQFLYFIFCILFLLYSIWTWTLADPNLVLTSFQPYWVFQNFMWSIDKHVVTIVYALLVTLFFFMYWMFIEKCKVQNEKYKTISSSKLSFILLLFPIFFILLFSYNALSHDVFNYMFNAKMVIVYQANPHIQTALHFSEDLWVRFMHNIHTPAPYFYGWTAVSLIPYILGFGKFTPTWILFRLWSILGFSLLVFSQTLLLTKVFPKNWKKHVWKIFLFTLNPLVLIEIISNSHNDAWMMAPAIFSLVLIVDQKSKRIQKNIAVIFVSFLLLVFSISIKYATLLLFPIWLFILCKPIFEKYIKKFLPQMLDLISFITEYIYDFSSIALFLPLLTPRSQQFHPWYLIWSMSFLPFIKLQWLRNTFIVLSVSSLFRYIPWIWNGAFAFNDAILMNQKMITWIPLFVYFGLYALYSIRKRFLPL